MFSGETKFDRRKRRIRYSIKQKSKGKLRLSVHRTGQHIYAQIIDNDNGITLACSSTLDKDFVGTKTANIDAAFKVGEAIARKAMSGNLDSIVFDRGGFLFHGRIKAVADGARKAGLVF